MGRAKSGKSSDADARERQARRQLVEQYRERFTKPDGSRYRRAEVEAHFAEIGERARNAQDREHEARVAFARFRRDVLRAKRVAAADLPRALAWVRRRGDELFAQCGQVIGAPLAPPAAVGEDARSMRAEIEAYAQWSSKCAYDDRVALMMDVGRALDREKAVEPLPWHSEPGASSVPGSAGRGTHAPMPDGAMSDWRSSSWFVSAAPGVVTTDSLRKAAARGELESRLHDRRLHYRLGEVAKVYPTARTLIDKALAEEKRIAARADNRRTGGGQQASKRTTDAGN